jgi:5'-3' exonuclease
VTIYSQTKKCELTLKDPEIDFRKFKALVGDKSDNIPSVTGPVTASNLLHTGGKLEEWLDDGITRCEKIPKREAYERNLRLVSLLGSECIVPKVALPDVESEVVKHNLSFLRNYAWIS